MMLPSSAGGATTEQVGFFACGLEPFVRWLREGLECRWAMRRPGWTSSAHAVADLKPGGVLTRYACVPLGEWTALLSNGPNGTDVGVLPSHAARDLGCRAIRAVCADDESEYPARVLEVYGPAGEAPLALERSVLAANDGGRWVFEASGAPFSFEDQGAYGRRVKSSRFSREMLAAYLRALGVTVGVEPGWGEAWLLERSS